MAAAGHTKQRTKPRRELLRREIVAMLLQDRKHAISQRNPSAQLAATVKIAELTLRELTEEESRKPPIAKLTHRIVHLRLCPACLEKQPVSATPPPPEPDISRLQRGASGWDDPDPAPQPDPAPPTAPFRQPDVVRVPKTPEQMRRRHRGDPVVRGLL